MISNYWILRGIPFSKDEFQNGKVTPVFFGSALTNFGVETFFDAFVDMAPHPHARVADTPDGQEQTIDTAEVPFSAYVFKLQANMNPRHRDSTAFMRVCSGKFDRDMVVKHHRTKSDVRLTRPHSMVAKERNTVDVAYPGDVIGIINTGAFQIGDTISLTDGFNYKPFPNFSRKFLRGCALPIPRCENPLIKGLSNWRKKALFKSCAVWMAWNSLWQRWGVSNSMYWSFAYKMNTASRPSSICYRMNPAPGWWEMWRPSSRHLMR